MFHYQGEVARTFDTQLLVQTLQHVPDGGARIVFEGLSLPVLKEDFEHVGHEGRGGLCRAEVGLRMRKQKGS